VLVSERIRAVALLALSPGLWLACRGVGRPPETGFLDVWAAGPARWLMLPDEQRQLARVRTRQEALAFLDAFWRRRDPDGPLPGNPFEREFEDRVAAADRLYSEGPLRGSMTDRGRALVLLGPPPLLSYGPKPVPSWEPGTLGGKPLIETHSLAVETWTYHAADLPPRLCALLGGEDREPTVILSFVVDPRHTYMTDGGRFLEHPSTVHNDCDSVEGPRLHLRLGGLRPLDEASDLPRAPGARQLLERGLGDADARGVAR